MRVLAIISVFVLLGLKLCAQGEIADEKKALIRNERTFYFLLNTNGFGAGYSFGKMITARKKQLWNFDFSFVKDAKEVKVSVNPNYRRFVYGKANDFFVIRSGYGFVHRIYQKKDKGGIEIRYFYNAGISLGFLKPMYYYIYGNDTTSVKFDKSATPNIQGGDKYFKGLNELNVVPGIYAKIGSSFEFSKNNIQMNALEGGLIVDIYPKNIEIMANDQTKIYFLSLFISYRFGKIINPRSNSKKKRKEPQKKKD